MDTLERTAARCWWEELEDRHESMSAEERERWYETDEGSIYLGLLKDSWRDEWDELIQAAYEATEAARTSAKQEKGT